MIKFIKSFMRRLAGPIPANEVKWVVNDLGELGVRIGDTSYFMYKGESLVYQETHEDGTRMMQRPVEKREFGEVCRVPGFEVGSDAFACYFQGEGWFPLTDGEEPVSGDFKSGLAAFLDSNTVTCPHGCGQTIRVTDEEAHQSYGCDIAADIGRGPIAV